MTWLPPLKHWSAKSSLDNSQLCYNNLRQPHRVQKTQTSKGDITVYHFYLKVSFREMCTGVHKHNLEKRVEPKYNSVEIKQNAAHRVNSSFMKHFEALCTHYMIQHKWHWKCSEWKTTSTTKHDKCPTMCLRQIHHSDTQSRIKESPELRLYRCDGERR